MLFNLFTEAISQLCIVTLYRHITVVLQEAYKRPHSFSKFRHRKINNYFPHHRIARPPRRACPHHLHPQPSYRRGHGKGGRLRSAGEGLNWLATFVRNAQRAVCSAKWYRLLGRITLATCFEIEFHFGHTPIRRWANAYLISLSRSGCLRTPLQ